MFDSFLLKDEYISQMNALRELSRMIHDIKYGEIYRKGLRVNRYANLFKSKSLGALRKYCVDKRDRKKLSKLLTPFQREKNELSPPDYFNTERIAVYTCVFGNYDNPVMPITRPDNIDYYIITDCDELKNNIWQTISVGKFEEQLHGYSNVEKNRWFKMHPHLIFGTEYRYSVYIDGNILPITDFTEYINRITKPGIAMFWHRFNNCVYQEALYNIYDIKKAEAKEIEDQVEYLHRNGMPYNFGMTTCNIIARDHDNKICIKLCEEWWKEFLNGCKRDQLSFPFVVWRNGIKMSDIAVLGDDVWYDESIMILDHK